MLYLNVIVSRVQSLIPGRQEIFPVSVASRQALRLSQPPIQWVPGSLSPRVKSPWHETGLSPPFTAEVKIGGIIPPLPHTSSLHSA